MNATTIISVAMTSTVIRESARKQILGGTVSLGRLRATRVAGSTHMANARGSCQSVNVIKRVSVARMSIAVRVTHVVPMGIVDNVSQRLRVRAELATTNSAQTSPVEMETVNARAVIYA